MAVRVATAPGASMDPTAGLLVLERSPGLFSMYGEIDAATAPRISELGDVHGALQFDLSGVTFMDSSGIAALVRLYQRCERYGCTFRIVHCSPQVERLLQIVHLYATGISWRQPCERQFGAAQAGRNCPTGTVG